MEFCSQLEPACLSHVLKSRRDGSGLIRLETATPRSSEAYVAAWGNNDHQLCVTPISGFTSGLGPFTPVLMRARNECMWRKPAR